MELLRHCPKNSLQKVHKRHAHIYHHLSLRLQVSHVGLQHTKCGQNYNHLIHAQSYVTLRTLLQYPLRHQF